MDKNIYNYQTLNINTSQPLFNLNTENTHLCTSFSLPSWGGTSRGRSCTAPPAQPDPGWNAHNRHWGRTCRLPLKLKCRLWRRGSRRWLRWSSRWSWWQDKFRIFFWDWLWYRWRTIKQGWFLWGMTSKAFLYRWSGKIRWSRPLESSNTFSSSTMSWFQPFWEKF